MVMQGPCGLNCHGHILPRVTFCSLISITMNNVNSSSLNPPRKRSSNPYVWLCNRGKTRIEAEPGAEERHQSLANRWLHLFNCTANRGYIIFLCWKLSGALQKLVFGLWRALLSGTCYLLQDGTQTDLGKTQCGMNWE